MNTADWQEGHTHTCVCMYVLTPNHILSLHTIISSTKHFDKRNWQQGARYVLCMFTYAMSTTSLGQAHPSAAAQCNAFSVRSTRAEPEPEPVPQP